MQSKIKVLLIDDDEMVCAVLPKALKNRDILADVVGDTSQARDRMAGEGYDMLLLDVTMPGQSGLQFLEEIRDAGDAVPVVMVTSDNAQSSRMKGFELGADDYVTKPFEPDELAARIKAVFRRSRLLPIVQIRDLLVDFGHRTVTRGDSRIDLSPREFEVLIALIEVRGAVLSRKRLLEQVWNVDFEPGTAMVEVQIARLRKKIDTEEHSVIQTVPGKGYCIPRN
jgi:DNA-binding response OmpR family regulator